MLEWPDAWYPEDGSRKNGHQVQQRQRPAKRVCAKCEVRPECLREAYSFEDGRWMVQNGKREWHRRKEHGIWGGWNAQERHHPSIRHLDTCDRKGHRTCRPVEERIAMLEERFVNTVYIKGLLTKKEKPAA
jgi:hypothetical protein